MQSPSEQSAWDLPAMLDVQDMATMLGCSTRHVYRLSGSGALPQPVRLRNLVRWPKQQIDDWISAGCPSTKRGGRR